MMELHADYASEGTYFPLIETGICCHAYEKQSVFRIILAISFIAFNLYPFIGYVLELYFPNGNKPDFPKQCFIEPWVNLGFLIIA